MRDTSLDEFIGGDAADVDEDERADSEEERGEVDGERTDLENEREDSEDEKGRDEDESADVEDENGGDESADDAGRASGVDGNDEGGDAVRSAVSTSDWTPDGASCAACWEVVERRWRDGEELVCADCKSW